MSPEELIELLRSKGYKATPQRLAICNEVLSRTDHPTAEEVHEAVSKQNPTISLTTVYHTLDLLEDLGLLDELQFDDHKARFDPNTSVHINIVCKKCGKIQDYQSDTVEKFWKTIISELDEEPQGQRIDIYIVCKDCIQ